MNGRTHLLGGITAGLILSSMIKSNDVITIAGVVVSVSAAMIPDRIQYNIKSIRLPLENHRGFSHTLLFAIITALLINPAIAPFWFAGLLSHMLLDLPSDAGIPLLWPIVRRRVALGWFRNGSAGEVVTRGLLCGVCAFVVMTWL